MRGGAAMWCRHRWMVRAVTHGETTFLVRGVATAVLYVCGKCGIAKTESLNGWWTPEQLAPARAGEECVV